jgi:hypothetical protein
MKRELFSELMASMEDALDHTKGKRDLTKVWLPYT